MLYPIGQQDFASIRKRGFVYVDKTDLVYKMANEGKYYFLSRPRRFGKSLLLSTLKYYFRGDKELFQGLAIEQLEAEWPQHPVLHLTFGKGEYATMDDLNNHLHRILSEWEESYGSNEAERGYGERFTGIIKRAHAQTGQQVVILIDEYDAPLQAALDKPELMVQYQSKLRDIYLCLKNNDEYIRFAFLTGITAWGKVGVFSALNNLEDITFSNEYATLCGITEAELHRVFPESVAQLAEKNGLTIDEAYQKLKEQYDGYHFAKDSEGVYNPFSLLNALKSKNYDNYWIRTGETQLVANLAQQVNIDIDSLLTEVSMPVDNMLNEKNYLDSPFTFLYQAGYLTIKGRDDDRQEYMLTIPNNEVRGSLSAHLVSPALGMEEGAARKFRGDLRSAVNNGRVEDMVALLNEYIFFKGNYMTMGKKELYFQNTLATVFRLSGYEVEVEKATARGRIDLLVKTEKYLYIVETKLDGNAQAALDQINAKGYADAYKNELRKVVKLGLNFSEKERIITDFAVEM